MYGRPCCSRLLPAVTLLCFLMNSKPNYSYNGINQKRSQKTYCYPDTGSRPAFLRDQRRTDDQDRYLSRHEPAGDLYLSSLRWFYTRPDGDLFRQAVCQPPALCRRVEEHRNKEHPGSDADEADLL